MAAYGREPPIRIWVGPGCKQTFGHAHCRGLPTQRADQRSQFSPATVVTLARFEPQWAEPLRETK